jgi:hypothetical protein
MERGGNILSPPPSSTSKFNLCGAHSFLRVHTLPLHPPRMRMPLVPPVTTGQVPEADWIWWNAVLKALDDRVGRSMRAAGVRRILSEIKNNHGESSTPASTVPGLGGLYRFCWSTAGELVFGD